MADNTQVGQDNADNQPLTAHETEMIRGAAAGDPTIIPQQFNGDVEKFIKAVNDQRAYATRVSQENAQLREQLNSTNKKADEGKLPDRLSIEEQVEQLKDITMEDIQADFAANNFKLSESMRNKIKEQIPAHMHSLVDRLEQLESQAAHNDIEKAAQLLGGADNVTALMEWARTNLSAAEKRDINAALAGSSWALKEATLTWLANKAEGQLGKSSAEPSFTVSNVAQNAGSPAGFSGVETMLQAMSDPRYGTDADYTRQVERMAASTEGVYQRKT